MLPLPSMSSQSLSSSPSARCYVPLLAIWIENNSLGIKLSTLTVSLASVWLVRLCRRFALPVTRNSVLASLVQFRHDDKQMHSMHVLAWPPARCTAAPCCLEVGDCQSVLSQRSSQLCFASCGRASSSWLLGERTSASPAKDQEDREAHDVEAPARHAFQGSNQQFWSPSLRFDCLRRGVSDRRARMGNAAGSLYEDRARVLTSCSSETFINFYLLMASTNFTMTSSAWPCWASSIALSCSSTRRRARRTRPSCFTLVNFFGDRVLSKKLDKATPWRSILRWCAARASRSCQSPTKALLSLTRPA